MAAGIQQIEHTGRGSLPGGKSQPAGTTLEFCHTALERVAGRVRGACIDVLVRLAESFPGEGRAGDDRRHYRTGCGIGGRPGVDAAGGQGRLAARCGSDLRVVWLTSADLLRGQQANIGGMSAERSLAPDLAAGSRTDELLGAGTRWLEASSDSPRLDAELLLAHALDKPRTWLYQTLSAVVPTETAARYAALLGQRAAHRPLAQITGMREFWSLGLQVTVDTLVPRPETELLVELALRRIPADMQMAVADLGTGTGAIAIAIARERPRCRVVATDLSHAALAVARHNGAVLGSRQPQLSFWRLVCSPER
jgi:hypothetical protein